MDSRDTSDKIFIPLPPLDPKPNLITPESFVSGVDLSGTNDAHYLRYLIPSNFDDDAPRPICRPSKRRNHHLSSLDISGASLPLLRTLRGALSILRHRSYQIGTQRFTHVGEFSDPILRSSPSLFFSSLSNLLPYPIQHLSSLSFPNTFPRI